MLNIQEVYEQYFTVVYRYLLSLSHNTHIAEELTQETFFKALKKVDDSEVTVTCVYGFARFPKTRTMTI